MKNILAYGDSLTFGASPLPNGPRHAYEDRWATRLEAGLNGKARVFAEGLGGRTTVFDDWAANFELNGAKTLPVMLATHSPLDLVILFLGTNDLKPYINGSALQASFGVRRLIQVIRGHFGALLEPIPQIMIVAPPHLVASANSDVIERFGGSSGIAQSQTFASHYAKRAAELGVAFFDASTVAKADPADGVHLDAQNTRAIGDGLVPVVKSLLGL